MNYRSLSTITLTCFAALPLAGCVDDPGTDTGDATETGTGDGDPGDGDGDGDGDPGDGDGDGDGDPNFALCSCADFPNADCHQVSADDEEGLQIAANSLEEGSVLVLGAGVFELDNQVTIRADGITVCGQGMGEEGNFELGTILDFATQATQSNGLDVVGNDFAVRDLAIVDAKKDGLRIEDSDGVTIQRVRATWRKLADPTNGSYGLYPVKVSRVLIEDSAAYNSSDAGIYVGQCRNAIVRNNVARGNVAGIEIENTQYADVYGNLAEENTGGLLIFDLPGNPVIGRDIHIHDNIVRNNNTPNFAPGGTVRAIPVGTGTFAMASRRVKIDHNTYENNGTGDIAVISGFTIEPDPEAWGLSMSEIIGDISDLGLPMMDETVYNYRTEDIWIHDNTHTGSGTNPFLSTPDQEFGVLLAIIYANHLPIDPILYDAIEESMISADDPAMNSNDRQVCVGGTNTGATFASLDIPALAMGATFEDIFRPEAPFAPFDCNEFRNGQPIIPPDME